MEIYPVTTKRDQRDFIRLPFRLYRDDPRWVPPILSGERARFREDFAFYAHSEAAYFLARGTDGQAVGRIAVLDHRPHNEYRGKRDALLHLYECVEDESVAAALFAEAEAWARTRSLTRLLGPKGFLTADPIGLLVEGFEYSPAVGIPYNPPYYPAQWEANGLRKCVDYLSAHLIRPATQMPDRVRRIAAKIKERRGFHVPHFRSTADLRRYIEPVKRAYNAAFADLWAYTPVPDEEVEALFNRLTFLVSDPNLITLVFKGEDLIGFQFAYPDITPALRFMRGRLLPFGWLAILIEKNRTTHLNINGNAVLPQYQGLGANAVLYQALFETVLSGEFTTAEVVQIQEENRAMLSDLDHVGETEITKRHRVYEKVLSS